jgi:hypothetical protein
VKDTRPINMLILTVFMVALMAFATVAVSMNRPQTAVEMQPATINDSANYSAVNTIPASRPVVMHVFQTLTTLSAEMCRASAQTGPVQLAGGRLPGMHSLAVQPLVVICSLHAV